MGEGPEFVVESYILYIVSDYYSYYTTNDIYSTKSNLSLEYNMVYTVSIVSRNCAGRSEPLSISNILFGEYRFIY